MWRHYFVNNDAIIYVIDSSDRKRLPKAKEELLRVLADEEMKDVALLVLANKQDIA